MRTDANMMVKSNEDSCESVSKPINLPPVNQTTCIHQNLERDLSQRPYFPRFGDLPIELRSVIWQLATNESRTVAVGNGKNNVGFKSLTPPPATLHACRESRQISLLKYDLTFSGQGCHSFLKDCFPPTIYFNFERDVLYFRDAWESSPLVALGHESVLEQFLSDVKREEVDRIKSVCLDIVSSLSEASLLWLSYFNPKGLRTLYIATEDQHIDARKPFHLAELEERNHFRFLNEVGGTFSGCGLLLEDPAKPNESIEFLATRGLVNFPKLRATLRQGDTPDLRLVQAVQGSC